MGARQSICTSPFPVLPVNQARVGEQKPGEGEEGEKNTGSTHMGTPISFHCGCETQSKAQLEKDLEKESVLVFLGCYNKVSQTGVLTTHNTVSQFWRPEAGDHGAGRLAPHEAARICSRPFPTSGLLPISSHHFALCTSVTVTPSPLL